MNDKLITNQKDILNAQFQFYKKNSKANNLRGKSELETLLNVEPKRPHIRLKKCQKCVKEKN